MKNLAEEQRKMRERMRAAGTKKAPAGSRPEMAPKEPTDLQTLLKRIAVLEAENASLRRQLSTLQSQPAPQTSSHDMSERERRHMFMKYSNVRRYY